MTRGGRDAKETGIGLPDLRLFSPVGPDHFSSFLLQCAGNFRTQEHRDWSKDFMCFLFPVNSSAKQFLDKIFATSSPVPMEEGFYLFSTLWAEIVG